MASTANPILTSEEEEKKVGGDDGVEVSVELADVGGGGGDEDAKTSLTEAASSGGGGGDEDHHHAPNIDGGHHHLSKEEFEKLSKFEALDYEDIENKIMMDNLMHTSVCDERCKKASVWIIFAINGIVVGCISYLIHYCVAMLLDFRVIDKAQEHMAAGEVGLAYAWFVGLSVSFVTASTLMVNFIAPAAGGSGIPELKAYLNGTAIRHYFTLKTLVVKVIGVILSVSGGLTVGKEGPLVHAGAVLANQLSHMNGVPECGRCCGCPKKCQKAWSTYIRTHNPSSHPRPIRSLHHSHLPPGLGYVRSIHLLGQSEHRSILLQAWGTHDLSICSANHQSGRSLHSPPGLGYIHTYIYRSRLIIDRRSSARSLRTHTHTHTHTPGRQDVPERQEQARLCVRRRGRRRRLGLRRARGRHALLAGGDVVLLVAAADMDRLLLRDARDLHHQHPRGVHGGHLRVQQHDRQLDGGGAEPEPARQPRAGRLGRVRQPALPAGGARDVYCDGLPACLPAWLLVWTERTNAWMDGWMDGRMERSEW